MKCVRLISVFLLCSSVIPSITWGARILGVFPIPARSHYILGSALMTALAEQGHDVTVISPYEEKNPPKNGSYKDVVVTGLFEIMKATQKDVFEKAGTSMITRLPLITMMMANLTEMVLAHPDVQQLIHSGETFDVAIIEQFFNDAHKILAPHFKAPLILFNAMGTHSLIGSLVGNPTPPSYIPELSMGYTAPLTFFERVGNSFGRLFTDLLFNLWVYPKHNEIVKKQIPNAPNLDDVLYNASLVLLNSHPSLNPPVPLVPCMIEIGGFHVKPAKTLPADLQRFFDEAEDGVIYFSMGSNLRSADLPASKRDVLLKVFGRLKQKVLWKFESDDLPGKPDNVRISKWLPQQEILAHPNVKLFITHGGLLSTTETVYHGVPILAIPIYGDQNANADGAVSNGIGLKLEYKDITEDNLNSKLQELLQNPKYRDNVKTRSKVFHDRQVSPIDRAIFWVEYVIRHKGAAHMRVAGIDLPWYKYLLLDVIGLFALFGIIFLYISLCVGRRVYRKIKSRCKRNKAEKKKKN